MTSPNGQFGTPKHVFHYFLRSLNLDEINSFSPASNGQYDWDIKIVYAPLQIFSLTLEATFIRINFFLGWNAKLILKHVQTKCSDFLGVIFFLIWLGNKIDNFHLLLSLYTKPHCSPAMQDLARTCDRSYDCNVSEVSNETETKNQRPYLFNWA